MVKATLYHSGHLLVLAKRSWERTRSNKSESEIAIILSVVALEAFLNELTHSAGICSNDHAPEEIKAFHSLLQEVENNNAQIQLKVQLAYYVLTKKTVDKGSALYQDFNCLIKLRNALVHAKPITVPWAFDDDPEYKPLPLLKHFIDRKIIDKPPNREVPWRQILVVPEVAAWAYDVAVRVIKWITASIPQSILNELTAFSIRELEEIDVV